MLVNISVGHDSNINILEAIQMLSAAWKMQSAATIVHCFHEAGTVPQDENEIESDCDVYMVQIFNI
jgi:hypothetical protein